MQNSNTANVCPVCGAPLTRKGAVYCGRDCYQKAHRSGSITRVCPGCGRTFSVCRADAERGRMKSCSLKCRNLLSRTQPTIEYKGVVFHRRRNGAYLSGHPPYAYLHRVIWEEKHGPIPARHIVRHRDGDRGNNEPANLELVARSEVGPLKPGTQCLRCDLPARAKGLCRRHYQQLRAHEKGGWKQVKGAHGAPQQGDALAMDPMDPARKSPHAALAGPRTHAARR